MHARRLSRFSVRCSAVPSNCASASYFTASCRAATSTLSRGEMAMSAPAVSSILDVPRTDVDFVVGTLPGIEVGASRRTA